MGQTTGDEFNFDINDPNFAANLAAMLPPVPPTRSESIDKLAKNIIAQGSMGHWSTGSGLSKESAAQMMAQKMYDQAGITRLEDFGQFRSTWSAPVATKDWISYPNEDGSSYTVEAWRAGIVRDANGNLVRQNGDDLEPLSDADKARIVTKQGYNGTDGDGADVFIPLTAEQQSRVKNGQITFDGPLVYGNKATQQAIPVEYSRAKPGDWGGTFAGDSSSGFGVQFNSMGMPMFYTHYDTDNSWMGPLGMVLTVGSFIPGVAPFAMAANAALQASQGNTLGAVLSALGSTAGFVGSGLEAVNGMDLASDLATSGSSANILANINNAQQAIGVMNAVSKGNFAGLLGSLANLGPQIGVTIPEDVMKPIQLAAVGSAVSRGDWAGAMQAAGTLTNSSDLALASKGANIVRAVQSGNPASMLNATVGFAKSAGLDNSVVKDAFKASGFAATDQQINDIFAAQFPANNVQAVVDENTALKNIYKEYTGHDATVDDLAKYIGMAPVVAAKTIGDSYTTSDEAAAEFKSVFGRDGTPEELAQYVGKTDADSIKAIQDLFNSQQPAPVKPEAPVEPAPTEPAPTEPAPVTPELPVKPPATVILPNDKSPTGFVDENGNPVTEVGVYTGDPQVPATGNQTPIPEPIAPVEPAPVEPAPVEPVSPVGPGGYTDEITGHWITVDPVTGKETDTGSSDGSPLNNDNSGNPEAMKDWKFDPTTSKWAWTDPATGETTNYEYETPIRGGPLQTGKDIEDKAGAGSGGVPGGTVPKVTPTIKMPTTASGVKIPAPVRATTPPATSATPATTPAPAVNTAALGTLLTSLLSNQQPQYMPSVGDVAHIKSNESLFGALPGSEPAPASSAQEGQPDPVAELQSQYEDQQYASGGHVDDFSVDALLQILRS